MLSIKKMNEVTNGEMTMNKKLITQLPTVLLMAGMADAKASVQAWALHSGLCKGLEVSIFEGGNL